ncbi:MAG: DUF4271 domain-containing protein [Prolixibacteraceae bacterium]|nr:DUF4271 domain-containing protein [Prolixibacteraceae bacterium]
MSTETDTIVFNPAGNFIAVDYSGYTAKNDSSVTITEQTLNDFYTVELPLAKRNTFFQNWSILLIIFLLSLLASVRYASGSYLVQLFQTFYKKGTITRLYREKANNIIHVSFRLSLLFFFVAGLYIYHLISFINKDILGGGAILYITCLSALSLFMAGKFILYRFSGILFDSKEEVQEYIFNAKTGNRIMGLLLFPVVILTFFASGIFTKIILFTGVIIIAIISIFNVFRGIEILSKKVFSIYYMILYLCSLEILPLLIVLKILWGVIE